MSSARFGRSLVWGFALGLATCAPKTAHDESIAPAPPPSLHASSPPEPPPLVPGIAPLPPEGERFESEYSRIVVREKGTVRTLYFVDEAGGEHIESRMDVAKPEELVLRYAWGMFASYLFVPEPRRVLIVGVGAGSMIRFLEHYDPEVHVVGVEIDKVVLDVARDYFGTKANERVELIAADGFDYIQNTEHAFDVIYLDAFLKPAADSAIDTDASGVPRRLKTIATYRKMQDKLTPGGIVVVNLHHNTLDDDVATLREAFTRGYVFDVPDGGNYILVGVASDVARTRESLASVGRRVDARLHAGFSFASLAGWLRNEP